MTTETTNDVFRTADANSVICTTTNGIVKHDGTLVMGAGNAKQTATLCPGIALKLGKFVKQYGNRCFNCGTYTIHNKLHTICSFPTKGDYRNKSSLPLIIQSAQQIMAMADKFNWTKVYVPIPGCGCGGLNPTEVLQALHPMLDDRFIIISRELTLTQ